MNKLRWTKQVDSSSVTAPSGVADAMATQNGLLTIISASQPTLEQMSLRAFYDAVKSIEKDKIKSK